MRVYEFSKQHNIPTKELIELLRTEGFEVASHMSVLNDSAINFLMQKFSKREKPALVEKAPQEKIIPTQQVKEVMEIPSPESKIKSSIQQPAPKIQPRVTPSFVQPEISSKHKEQQELLPASITLEPHTLSDIAEKFHKPVTELIMQLLKWGILSNKNQLLPIEMVSRVAEHYGVKTEKIIQKQQEIKRAAPIASDNLKERLPIVVVVGHVDHGKTTLLDFIRNTRIAAREKGGITQHLGAYEAQTKQGNIIFLDTPGHEAFSKMRARGIKVADLAILVVAADDSVMPQTIEAVKHIKEIGVPIIVAVNKIDKVDASRVDIVKRDLAQYDLLPEEWGGSVVYVPISAKLGTGVDLLLEMLVLQSQLMELKADATGPASGYVIESRLEKGRGAVATLLLQQGTLQIGDYFSCGSTGGKINSIVDSYGKKLQHVGPAIPAQIAGFDQLPEAGDFFEVISKDDVRKAKMGALKKVVPPAARKLLVEGAKNLIVKTDTNSSKEALLESIAKVSSKVKKGFNIISAGVGDINESDVMLAADTGSDIYSLHIKSEPNAQLMAQRLSVHIASFGIIYKLLEALEKVAESNKEIKMIKKKIGEAVVRKVFDIKNIGVIAGCYVKDGIINRDCTIVAYRGKQKVGEGKISSLQREKKTVKEVHAGFECGFMVQDFNDWQPDDRVECFIQVPAEVR